MHGDLDMVWLENGSVNAVCDIMIMAPKAKVFCMYLKRETVDGELANVATGTEVKMAIAKAHALLGHRKEASIWKTAKQLR